MGRMPGCVAGVCFYSLIFKAVFIYLKEFYTARGRGRGLYHPVAGSLPNGLSGWSWTRSKPGSEGSFRSPMWVQGSKH